MAGKGWLRTEDPVHVTVHEIARAHHHEPLRSEVLDADVGLRSEGMPGGEHRYGPADDQVGPDQVDRCVVPVQHVDEAEVERTLGQPLVDLRLLQRQHLDGRAGQAVLEGPDRRHQERRGGRVDRAEADQPAVRPLVAGGDAEPVDGGKDLDHVGQQVAPLAADLRAGPAPVEQGDAELALELGDGLAERRLRDVELLARSA